jgi:large subunit ribosomal protein L17
MKRVVRAHSDFLSTQLRNQLTSLVLFEAITTTTANAKDLLPFANRFFNRVKSANLDAKKIAHATLFDKKAIEKVFEEILPRYKKDDTTFVRSLKTAPRKGDNAPQTLVSLIAPLKVEEKPAKTTDQPKKAQAKKAVK